VKPTETANTCGAASLSMTAVSIVYLGFCFLREALDKYDKADLVWQERNSLFVEGASQFNGDRWERKGDKTHLADIDLESKGLKEILTFCTRPISGTSVRAKNARDVIEVEDGCWWALVNKLAVRGPDKNVGRRRRDSQPFSAPALPACLESKRSWILWPSTSMESYCVFYVKR
jgi:hypothetical protein